MDPGQDSQHTAMTMEQLHQVVQTTLNSGTLVHNIQIPLSPRQMSTIMIKTNQLGHNFNLNNLPPSLQQLTRNNEFDDFSQYLGVHFDLAQKIGRIQDDINQRNELANVQQSNSVIVAHNMVQHELNQDLRNSIQLMHSLGTNLTEGLPQNLDRSDSAILSQQLNHDLNLSHHLNRSQDVNLGGIDLQQGEDLRRGLALNQSTQSLIGNQSLGLPSLEAAHDRIAGHELELPSSFPIKTELEDEQNYYEVFVNNSHDVSGNMQMDHQPSGTSQSNQEPIYPYFNNQVPNVTNAPIDLYSRQQTFLQNYNLSTQANRENVENNPQNLVVHRQYESEYLNDNEQKLQQQKDDSHIKNLQRNTKSNQTHTAKENLRQDGAEKAFFMHENENVSCDSNEKNGNGSCWTNKMAATDDMAYKSLIEAELSNIKGEYSCYKCKEIFTSKRSLKQHSRVCSESTDAADNEKNNKFNCPQCVYKCQSPAILKIHQRTHTGEKPFSCNFCDYKSGQKNNVAKHILVHMNEKPFHCQFCDYKCAQKNNLVVHERTHTGYKPFACTFCDYRTVQKPNLVKHMYLHTNQKPFSCDLCSYKCVQKTNLTKHKQRHLNEKLGDTTAIIDEAVDSKSYRPRQKTVKCHFCGYKCIQKSSLDKHMQFKHPDMVGIGLINSDVYLSQNCEIGGEIQNLSVKKDGDVSSQKTES